MNPCLAGALRCVGRRCLTWLPFEPLILCVRGQLVSDLRAFNDHDTDADGVISLAEASAALTQLGVTHEVSSLEMALHHDDDSPRPGPDASAGGGQQVTGAAERSGFNKAAFVTLVKTLASETMRKRKQAAGEPLLMARSVLGETTKKLLIA